VNEGSPFNDVIYSSNLCCVTGDTKILTREYGHIPIKDVAGQTLECWNGTSWSKTPLFQTSERSKVFSVTLSNGAVIRATDYHKWYIKNDYDNPPKQVTTLQLQPGDKLEKFSLEPITHGTKVLEYAYESGFKTGDGSDLENGRAHIHLYSEDKQSLIKYMRGYTSVLTDQSVNKAGGSRITLYYGKDAKGRLLPKFVVPSNEYSVKSRLLWLAGLIDSDGCLTDNAGAQSVQIVSIEFDFLEEVRLMLQELGVDAKVVERTKAGYRTMPTNDGEGGVKEYWCKATRALLIPHGGLVALHELGYEGYRIILPSERRQRNATAFVKVVSVEDKGDVEPTFCGNELIHHKLMFNGVLTGNCEIILPTRASKYPSSQTIEDITTREYTTITTEQTGLTALCNLSSINVDRWMEMTLSELRAVAKELLEASDNLIDYQAYPTKNGEIFNRKFRAIGIGMNNLAYYYAKRNIKFSDEAAKVHMERISKSIHTVFNEASYNLALERGSFEWIHRTNITEPRRFATLFAIAPTATSSLIINATEGIEPVSKILSEKTGTYSTKQIVPGILEYGMSYELAADIPTAALYELAAIRQKYLDQGQSVNTYAKDPESAYEVIKDIIYAESIGLPTLYYLQSSTALEGCESCGS